MTIEALDGYSGNGPLMQNYGWVQNTSNLATIRDSVVELFADGMPMNHNAVMRGIREYRLERNEIKKKWSWDARCRIKAACALGMIKINRVVDGYEITELGQSLICAPRPSGESTKRSLSSEEIELFRAGLLTSAPVIRVLELLDDAYRNGEALSKYDIGSELGFLADVGFTHYEADWVAKMGYSFNDKEGDADKWARTILSWLLQVGWIAEAESAVFCGRKLKRYHAKDCISQVLRYSSKSATRYVPEEMLCSDRHPFSRQIQRRRFAELRFLNGRKDADLETLREQLLSDGIEIDLEILSFDMENLRRAGFRIVREQSCLLLLDKLELSENSAPPGQVVSTHQKVLDDIQHHVVKYEKVIPPRLINNLFMNGHAETGDATEFEYAVEDFYNFMGFNAKKLGQGRGRVADVIAQHNNDKPILSYAIIIDAKAYARYSFPAADIRKMKEYIDFHVEEIMSKSKIGKFAFAFISCDFTDGESALCEIAESTSVNGSAIDISTLIHLGYLIRSNEIDFSDLYEYHTCNMRVVMPSL